MNQLGQRFYPILGMVFVTLLLTANIVSEKPVLMGSFIIPAGLLLFPITYLLGAVCAEVYGFRQSRQLIWMAMLCNVFMAMICHIAIILPSVDTWELSTAYSQVLSRSSRLMLISVFSYGVGELMNAYVVVRLKQRLQGKHFWMRALCGSWIGEALETSLFVPLAFYQTFELVDLLHLMGFYYLFKLVYAICAVPVMNVLVVTLKRYEILEKTPGNLKVSRSS